MELNQMMKMQEYYIGHWFLRMKYNKHPVYKKGYQNTTTCLEVTKTWGGGGGVRKGWPSPKLNKHSKKSTKAITPNVSHD